MCVYLFFMTSISAPSSSIPPSPSLRGGKKLARKEDPGMEAQILHKSQVVFFVQGVSFFLAIARDTSNSMTYTGFHYLLAGREMDGSLPLSSKNFFRLHV